MDVRKLAVVALCFLLISCREHTVPKEPQVMKSTQVELKMADGTTTNSANLLYAGEFRKISSQTARLTADMASDSTDSYHVIDSIATALSSKLFMETNPEIIISKLNDCFFNQMGITVDDNRGELANVLPDRVYRTKEANVIGAVMLMLLVGEKSAIPLVCVKAKSHYFIRFDDGKARINIELRNQGAINPDSWYIENYKLTNGDSLRALSTIEALAVLRYGVGCAAIKAENTEMAIVNFAYGVQMFSGFRESRYQLDKIIDNEKTADKLLSSLIQLRITYQDLHVLDECLASLYLREKNFKSAADYFLRALERSPGKFEFTRGAGIAYLNLHNFDSARVFLTEAKQSHPSDSLVNALLEQCK